MTNVEFNRRVTKACAWCGPAMVLLFLIGVVSLAGFFAPPTSALLTAPEIATYHADTTSPEVLQSWNDAAWMGILFGVPPFSLWCLAIAAAILRDDARDSGMPRWSAYLNIWCAIFYVPAMMMIFFRSGPFSQNGILAFWIPVGVFFFWIVSMTVLVSRAIDKQAAADHEVGSSRDTGHLTSA